MLKPFLNRQEIFFSHLKKSGNFVWKTSSAFNHVSAIILQTLLMKIFKYWTLTFCAWQYLMTFNLYHTVCKWHFTFRNFCFDIFKKRWKQIGKVLFFSIIISFFSYYNLSTHYFQPFPLINQIYFYYCYDMLQLSYII